MVTKDRHGALVDSDGAGGALKIREPAFFRLHGEAARDEKRAGAAAGEKAREDFGFGPAGNEDSAAGFGGEFGGGDF